MSHLELEASLMGALASASQTLALSLWIW